MKSNLFGVIAALLLAVTATSGHGATIDPTPLAGGLTVASISDSSNQFGLIGVGGLALIGLVALRRRSSAHRRHSSALH